MEKLTIKGLDPIRAQMIEMGISKEQFMKEAGFVASIWNDPKNKYLRTASKESLFAAVISIAQTGLTLNPVAKQAYLIPRQTSDHRGKKIVQAHLEPSYIGLVKLLTDAGQVLNLQTNLVYEGDEFDVMLGMETQIKHRPHYVLGNEAGKIVGLYCIGNLASGHKQFEYMTRNEVEEIRSTSESYKAYMKNNNLPCIWVTYEGEMFRKTIIKRIAKHLPRSKKYDQAAALANRDYEMTLDQLSMIESLLETSTLLDFQKNDIEYELSGMSYDGANKCIRYLKANQPDPIESGGNYSQKDIQRKLDEKV